MTFNETILKGSFEINVNTFQDERGWFTRTYCKNEFKNINHTKEWLQLNHSFTNKKGTIRGFHFQLQPFGEIKMVRCIAGTVYDVIVDVRKNSSTFLQWVGIELSASNRKMIYIPEGFAHGFQTLTDNCELIYHHSEFYTANEESGIKYDDPTLKVIWPLPLTNISERDRQHDFLQDNFIGI